jgi:hypothetical protein
MKLVIPYVHPSPILWNAAGVGVAAGGGANHRMVYR